MPKFKYTAKDDDGKAIVGFIEADDRDLAINMLRKKNVIIVSVGDASSGLKIKLPFFSKNKVKLDDIVIFARQLATMVEAGIPLVSTLDILTDQSDNKVFGAVISEVRNDISSGLSLSEAMSKRKNIFSSLFVNMVKAGESSGMLDEILDRLAGYMEKTSSLQKKVRSALVYPATVSVMALAITLILLLKVIPVFKTIFQGFDAKLPAPASNLHG
jgi:type IV pilus assembly protein PilC